MGKENAWACRISLYKLKFAVLLVSSHACCPLGCSQHCLVAAFWGRFGRAVPGRALSHFQQTGWALVAASSFQALFVTGSGQQQLGKWWEIPYSLNHPISLQYIVSSVLLFLLLPSVFKRRGGFRKGISALAKAPAVFTLAEVSIPFAAEVTVTLQRGWSTVLPGQGRCRRSKVSFYMPWSPCDK